jgi:hypothetical protein
MKNTKFTSIFLTLALIVSVFGSVANAQTAPSLGNYSVNVTGPHNAIISVSVNPNNSVINLHFKYWTGSMYRDIYYGNLSGTSYVNIDQGLFNLIPGSNYSYQIVAGSITSSIGNFSTPDSNSYSTGNGNYNYSNNNGYNGNYYNNGQTPNYNYSSYNYPNGSATAAGAPLAPYVTTGGYSAITSDSAVINGTVNPNNVYTSFWFELGTSPSLGQKTSVEPAGVGNTGQLVTANLAKLTPGATYYYRLAAQNSQGTNWGEMNSFTTTAGSNGSSGDGSQVLGSTSSSGTGTGNGTNGSGSAGSKSVSSGSVKTATTSRTPVTASNPAKDRPSFVSLEYSLGNKGALVLVADDLKPKSGEEFSYTVVYKNETDNILNGADLKVILPAQVDYVDSDKEPSNISANIVEFSQIGRAHV